MLTDEQILNIRIPIKSTCEEHDLPHHITLGDAAKRLYGWPLYATEEEFLARLHSLLKKYDEARADEARAVADSVNDFNKEQPNDQ